VDPERLPDAVVCYLDTTVALPVLTSYALAKREAREPRRLIDRREELMARLREDYLARE
jgi:deoxyhypusine synthase